MEYVSYFKILHQKRPLYEMITLQKHEAYKFPKKYTYLHDDSFKQSYIVHFEREHSHKSTL
jgi:hypothetical protein